MENKLKSGKNVKITSTMCINVLFLYKRKTFLSSHDFEKQEPQCTLSMALCKSLTLLDELKQNIKVTFS